MLFWFYVQFDCCFYFIWNLICCFDFMCNLICCFDFMCNLICCFDKKFHKKWCNILEAYPQCYLWNTNTHMPPPKQTHQPQHYGKGFMFLNYYNTDTQNKRKVWLWAGFWTERKLSSYKDLVLKLSKWQVIHSNKAIGVWHLPPTVHLAPKLKKEYTRTSTHPSGASCPVLVWTLPFSHRPSVWLNNYSYGFSPQILILIYLLTAIGLTQSGSSTVHIYTQTVHRTTQLTTLVGRLSGIRTLSGQIILTMN